MKPKHWTLLAFALSASTALAQPAEEGEIEMDAEEGQPSLDADMAAADAAPAPTDASLLQATAQPVSWSDIVTVIRKPFLKRKRWDLLPMWSVGINDNMIRHMGFGGQLNYFLTDVMSIGLEGQYYTHSFQESFDLVARQARRLPVANKYNWSAALNFHYVPVYGKFAIFDKRIVTWESFFTAGVGAIETEVVPSNLAFEPFKNMLFSPNVGASMRFFIFKWMTVDFGIRDYVFLDKFESTDRTPNQSASEAKDNGSTAVINHVMFQLGLSFWLPTSFEYTTFR